MADPNYTGYIAVAGEGQRFGIYSCRRCGVALIMDPEVDTMALHDDWHDQHDTEENK